MKPILKLFAICVLVAVAAQSQAATQISNLMEPWTGGGIGDIHAVTPNQKFGFSFTTGAGAYRLDSVVLEHFAYAGSLQSFGVELYRVDGFGPFGTVQVSFLGALANSFIDSRPTQWPGSTTFVGYSSATPLTLDPSSTYLVAAIEPANGLNETGLLFAAPGNYTISGDWITPPPGQFFSDSSGLWFAGPMPGLGGKLKMEINATPVVVPEPAVSTLLFGLLCLFRLRSQRY